MDFHPIFSSDVGMSPGKSLDLAEFLAPQKPKASFQRNAGGGNPTCSRRSSRIFANRVEPISLFLPLFPLFPYFYLLWKLTARRTREARLPSGAAMCYAANAPQHQPFDCASRR